MNIPPEVARSQGGHGIKGAVHGIKGGRPRLDLTDDERAERRRAQQRRAQQEAYRRRQGIPPKQTGPTKECRKNWLQKYFEVWGKHPGEPLSPEEFAERDPLWNELCAERQGG